MAITLEAGDPAPEFALPDQDGAEHRLRDYRGSTVVVYFYPRDGTPGCTKQACAFRDQHEAIRAEGAVVLGVSTDAADSHAAFRAEHGLPFPLLADEGAAVASAYGAWGEKTLYGRTSIGMTRSTFVIGPDGVLIKVWKRARAADNADAVLRLLRERRA